jgi:ELWxxDGT repeat protein
LEDRTLLAAALALDINTNTANSYIADMVEVNGIAFFVAGQLIREFPFPLEVSDLELWCSDGTAEGTFRLRDLNPGSASAFSQTPGSVRLANVNGTLFFAASDDTHGTELWKSDGTPKGTVLVKDIVVGTSSSQARGLVEVNGALYFLANDPIGIWAYRMRAEGPLVDEAARLLTLCEAACAPERIREPAAALMLRRLALIKVVPSGDSVVLTLTEKGLTEKGLAALTGGRARRRKTRQVSRNSQSDAEE